MPLFWAVLWVNTTTIIHICGITAIVRSRRFLWGYALVVGYNSIKKYTAAF